MHCGLPQCLCWVGVWGATPFPLWVWARGRPLHPHQWRLGGARVPSGCPLRASRAKSVWLTTRNVSPDYTTELSVASHPEGTRLSVVQRQENPPRSDCQPRLCDEGCASEKTTNR